MGQTAGDCKIVVTDQHQGSAEQQPTGFHAQLNTLNRSELLPQAGARPAECPTLPTLTIDDQQSNANAIRPNDSSAARGSNSIQSTYEALDLDIRQYNPEAKCPVNPEQSNLNESILPDENQNQNMIYSRLMMQQGYAGEAPVNGERPNKNAISGSQQGFDNSVASITSGPNMGTEPLYTNGERPNTNAIAISPQGFDNSVASITSGPNMGTEPLDTPPRDRAVPPSGNAIVSTYEALDLDTRQYNPEANCPVNPEQPNTNGSIVPDENQNQNQIQAKRILRN
jgi:predicted protein tyrosine phosphatase